MHKRTRELNEEIKRVKIEMLEDGWNAQRDQTLLKAQLSHLKSCRKRLLGGEWTGAKEGDVDEEFRDIKEPEYQIIEWNEDNFDLDQCFDFFI